MTGITKGDEIIILPEIFWIATTWEDMMDKVGTSSLAIPLTLSTKIVIPLAYDFRLTLPTLGIINLT